MKPIITVILPSLNVAPYIKRSIESVLNQSLSEIEVLCVDAGSDDGTFEMIERYAGTDDRIRLIKSDKKSYGYQVNKAINEARGEYIGIVETDDFIEKDMYQTLYDISRKNNIDVVKCNYKIFKEFSRNCFGNDCQCLPDSKLYDRVVEGEELRSLFLFDHSIWNGIYKKAFLIANRIYCSETPGASFQDIGFIQRVHNAAGSYYFCSRVLYGYRIDREEASTYSKKCMNNMCFEFKGLFDDPSIREDRKDLMKIKFAESFLGEYKKVLKMVEYDNQSSFLDDTYLWACKIIQDMGVYHVIDTELFNKDMGIELRLLLNFRDSFAKYRKIVDEENAREKLPLKSFIKNHQVVICGSGSWGKMLHQQLYDIGADVVAFADNDPSKWHDVLEFYPEITGLESAVSRFKEAVFMIANKYHSADIQQQLSSLGVRNEMTLVWNP